MRIISEIKKAVAAKYLTSTLWTVDAIPFYMDHAPQGTTTQPLVYPIICFYHVSTNNTMAMIQPIIKPTGWDYVNSRFQFSVYANYRQHVQAEDIMDRIEDVYHRVPLILGNNCTHIATFSVDGTTKFYDQKEKIWHLRQDMMILAGR